MNEANLVKRITHLATGDYFLAERGLSLIGSVKVTASGIPVGAATAPTAVVDGISFANAETALIQFIIPQDYAENADKLALRLVEVPSANAADTTSLGITSAQSRFRAGAAEDTTAKTAVAETAVASTGALVREQVVNLSGRGLKPGDVIQLTLTATGSGATEIILVGAALIYGSTLRAYNEDDNERNVG